MIKIVIPGDPRTKKNSQQILWRRRGNKKVPFIAPSEAFTNYQNEVGWLIPSKYRNQSLKGPFNLKCIYYMKTKRKVDLCNLLAATCDILVKYKVIEDDNKDVVVGHDYSRVYYDKNNPRVEIYLEEVDS